MIPFDSPAPLVEPPATAPIGDGPVAPGPAVAPDVASPTTDAPATAATTPPFAPTPPWAPFVPYPGSSPAPYPGSPPSPPDGRGRRWVAVAGVAVVAIALLAGTVAVATRSRRTEPAPGAVSGPVQLAAEVHPWQFEVRGVALATAITIDKFGFQQQSEEATPKAGHRFLIVDVELKDRSSEATEVSTKQVPLTDGDGRVHLPEANGMTDTPITADPVSLGSMGCIDCSATRTALTGGPVRIRLVYVVPEDAAGFSVRFRDLPPVPVVPGSPTRS